jgi:mono/diheme cytochrome c family protein
MSAKYFRIFLFSLLFCLAFTACSSSTEADLLVTQGEKIYTANCLGCHPSDAGQPSVGPNLVGLSTSLRDAGLDVKSILEESIREPGKQIATGYQNLMPSADSLGISNADIDALLAYLSTLDN